MRFPLVRYALRRLWRDRSVTLVALAVLALGIGANTALFTVVNAVLLKPLPYPSPQRLVSLRLRDSQFAGLFASFPVNAAHVDAWSRLCASCEAIAAIDSMTTTMTGTGESQQLDGARVTAGFFSVLGITPAPGRAFTAAEDRPGADGVAVISHAFWTSTFGGDPSVVGRTVTLDGRSVTVVGVLPPRTPMPGPQQLGELPRLPPRIDVLRPAAFTPDEKLSSGDLDYGVIARLRPGIGGDAARAELDALEPAIAKQTGDAGTKRAVVEPLQDLIVREAKTPLLVLLAATGGVLLIVCVNLANLLLARHAGRRRETAIRTALGAGRGTLIVESLAESLLLAIAGGALGAGVAAALTRIIAITAPAALPKLNALSFDARVLIFGVASTLLAGFLVGIIPALRSAAVTPGDTLKTDGYTSTEGPRGARARRALVGAQAAVSVALLVSTGLLVVSFERLMHVRKGFDTAGIVTADVALPPSVDPASARQLEFIDRAIARIRALPGVTSVAVTNRLPLRGQTVVNFLSYVNDTRPATERPLANYRYVSPDYFAAIGTPLLHGRTFRETDRGHQVVVLSAAAAEALWPGQDPIGKQVRTGGYLGANSEVIGVATDSRAVDLTRTDVLFTYLPYWLRAPWLSQMSFVVRSTVPAGSLGPDVRRTLLALDPAVAIPRIQTMDDLVDASVADRRFELSLMIAFGCAAAILAALGVYGVVSYSVARRGREMSIRIALGASAMDIHRLVFEEGITPVAIGIVAGLAASVALGRAMANLLFDVRPSDPAVMMAAAFTIVIATLVACAAPARRASREILLH
ncbi:MAG TPA: ABC transporter permease [Vicinamibacterales bacterium]|nr:ABC transporter permease [Vicinamibacterales bacterium]